MNEGQAVILFGVHLSAAFLKSVNTAFFDKVEEEGLRFVRAADGVTYVGVRIAHTQTEAREFGLLDFLEAKDPTYALGKLGISGDPKFYLIHGE
jgi:hypothetical protein